MNSKMNKKLFLSTFLLTLLITFLISCVKSTELTYKDTKYTFTPWDIVDLDKDRFQLKQMKDGKDYFFTKSSSKLNGFSSMYGASLLDLQQNKIKFTSNVNLQSSEARAIDLFQSLTKIIDGLFSDSIVHTDPQEYKADETFLIVSQDKFYLVLRKAELVYLVDIDGLALTEDEVKPGVIQKFQYVLANKTDFKL